MDLTLVGHYLDKLSSRNHSGESPGRLRLITCVLASLSGGLAKEVSGLKGGAGVGMVEVGVGAGNNRSLGATVDPPLRLTPSKQNAAKHVSVDAVVAFAAAQLLGRCCRWL